MKSGKIGWVGKDCMPFPKTNFEDLRKHNEYFFQACILGILHHVRPGFLSYPASHLVPYLRRKMYPPEQFPKMYSYRDVRSRFLAKVRRACCVGSR